MAGRLDKIMNLVRNMGWRYIAFRAKHELTRRTGLLKKRFPAMPPQQEYLTLSQWKNNNRHFFFKDKESLNVPRTPDPVLKETVNNLRAGKLLMFGNQLTDLGGNYDWITNPDSGFHYDKQKHWTQIADYSKEAGDIKLVWEKSRFSYLYDIIRYDYHYDEDCAQQVFDDIVSWIDNNYVNCGPNYRCSQEMSLRVLNWTFALHYYRNSPVLTDEIFSKMQYVIYWHMHHVYHNIDFSRIAVRNNHAITETLTLYLVGLLYPEFPGADVWKKKGRQWFEQEIAYQVYEDGTFLQFSMNYHRIVVQLLTWGITLAEKSGERFSNVVYDRAKKSLVFLRTCMVEENGWLPNYGANDGALFFKLSTAHYRDYRPQLQALGYALGLDADTGIAGEDAAWYGFNLKETEHVKPQDGIHSFTKGGYYVIREPQTLTFIRCGNHKDRPSQADNLHLDVWYKGENILPDAGSYKYNTDDQTIRYFSGTASHNTVMLDNKDQMLKGGRFIWYYWSQCANARLEQATDSYTFTGTIKAFTYIQDGITHRRIIRKKRNLPVWEVHDEIAGAPKDIDMQQLWHLSLDAAAKVHITAKDEAGNSITAAKSDGWYSSLYGQKEKTACYTFGSKHKKIDTVISINN